MTAEITKQLITEYIKEKSKILEQLHNKIKQELLLIDLKSFDTEDLSFEMFLNIYKSEACALMQRKHNFIDDYQRLTKTDFMSTFRKEHPDFI